ncbi:hypothetical protein [Devosia alba]|uniref:hypothetical protein n=1 Tax=Devosia alba TaxID=3152360 RepID=UPI00326456A6
MIANDNQKCTCTGPLCDCGANGIVKDGAGVRVPAHMMDGASGNLIVDGLTIDRATLDAYMSSPEHAHDKSKHEMVHGYLGDRAPAFDSAAACRMLADRIRQNDHMQANIDHQAKIAASPASYTRDGRLIADLHTSELAREKMIGDMNTWRDQ